MVKKVVYNLMRISLLDKHVGVRPRLMRAPICEGFERWAVDAKPNFFTVGTSLCNGCSGAGCTSAFETGLSSYTYSWGMSMIVYRAL
jgi:hypothetical protein